MLDVIMTGSAKSLDNAMVCAEAWFGGPVIGRTSELFMLGGLRGKWLKARWKATPGKIKYEQTASAPGLPSIDLPAEFEIVEVENL